MAKCNHQLKPLLFKGLISNPMCYPASIAVLCCCAFSVSALLSFVGFVDTDIICWWIRMLVCI